VKIKNNCVRKLKIQILTHVGILPWNSGDLFPYSPTFFPRFREARPETETKKYDEKVVLEILRDYRMISGFC
jgi:hypothetical protein